jgi:ATP-binding cassette subfamily F protein uup
VSHDRAFLDRVVTSLLVLDGRGGVQDFVGGWSDWAAWRDRRDAAQVNAVAPRRPESRVGDARDAIPAEGAAATAARRKLSYKDQRELEALPARIEALETERSALEALANDGAFYTRPHDEVRATLARLADLGPQIEAAYARWAALE